MDRNKKVQILLLLYKYIYNSKYQGCMAANCMFHLPTSIQLLNVTMRAIHSSLAQNFLVKRRPLAETSQGGNSNKTRWKNKRQGRKGGNMTALRFQTGVGHQTAPASFQGLTVKRYYSVLNKVCKQGRFFYAFFHGKVSKQTKTPGVGYQVIILNVVRAYGLIYLLMNKYSDILWNPH